MKNDHFLVFSAVRVLFPRFFGVTYVKTAQNEKSITYSCVPNCFHFVLFPMLAGRSVQSYEK